MLLKIFEIIFTRKKNQNERTTKGKNRQSKKQRKNKQRKEANKDNIV